MRPWGIHWFRRDLRLRDNPALAWNCKKHGGRVLGIFCVDPTLLTRSDFSDNRFALYLETLACLRNDLRAAGGDLLALDHGPEGSFEELLGWLTARKLPLPSTWTCSRDYEPFSLTRDSRIQAMLEGDFGVGFHSERDHLLIEPAELFRGQERGSYYQVFGAFKKKWLSLLETDEIRERVAFKANPRFSLRWEDVLGSKTRSQFAFSAFKDVLDDYRARWREKIGIELPQAGERAALQALKSFAKRGLDRYARDRDYPAVAGTSRLSYYQKLGSVTTAQIVRKLGLLESRAPNHSKYLDGLIWREFFYHILAHVPRVETTAFRFKYDALHWENRQDHFEAWKEGRTGYPIVDAAMRELKHTGWMHNRMRMVVSSFLTKDLLCDWKWGERHFMRNLLDGDVACNNGGWQWAASTGCDPQPYFRIFNPTLQGKRFDPKGEYIRRWVPELRELSDKRIHEPWRDGKSPRDYPRPIVDHAAQSRKALALFRDPSG